MRVNTFDGETQEPMGEHLWLGDVLGDDADEYQKAMGELKRSGRYWFGGGAQPLVLIMPCRH